MIRFGIIGTGVIAKQHVLGIRANKNAKVEAVCDLDEEVLKTFAEEHEVEKTYTDYHKMLEDPTIDAVSICTPSGMHGKMCIDAARAGKHILCEKPIEITTEALDKLVEEVEKSGVKMVCVFQRRFAPIPVKVKAALDSGVFGKVLMASAYAKYYRKPEYYASAGWRATWELDGGGALMNQGVHAIDLISWLMGGVKKVSAITRTQFHNIPVEDAAVATVEYNNGAIGVIEGSTCAKPAQSTRFEIYCENGSIIFDDKAIRSWFLNGEEMIQGEGVLAKDVGNDDPTRVLDNAHGYLVRDLIEAIENDTASSIGPREGRKAVDTILAIYKSSKEGKEVLL